MDCGRMTGVSYVCESAPARARHCWDTSDGKRGDGGFAQSLDQSERQSLTLLEHQTEQESEMLESCSRSTTTDVWGEKAKRTLYGVPSRSKSGKANQVPIEEGVIKTTLEGLL